MWRPTVTVQGRVAVLSVPIAPTTEARFYAEDPRRLVNKDARRCGWIIDVQGNRGGSIGPLFAGLSAFVPEGKILSFRDRNGRIVSTASMIGGTVKQSSTLMGGATESYSVGASVAKFHVPVAVLQSSSTASAGEFAVARLRAQKRVQTFGERTAGLTSGNVSLGGPGVALWCSPSAR